MDENGISLILSTQFTKLTISMDEVYFSSNNVRHDSEYIMNNKTKA